MTHFLQAVDKIQLETSNLVVNILNCSEILKFVLSQTRVAAQEFWSYQIKKFNVIIEIYMLRKLKN